jgi:hypothetical protein
MLPPQNTGIMEYWSAGIMKKQKRTLQDTVKMEL